VSSYEVRSYIPERLQKGRRKWEDKAEEQEAVYANRRRVRGDYGKSLLRRRGELVERSFAHCYDTGGMRRTHLRRHDNIFEAAVGPCGGFQSEPDLPRKLLGAGTPRQWKDLGRAVFLLFCGWMARRRARFRPCRCQTTPFRAVSVLVPVFPIHSTPYRKIATCTTG